VLAPPQIAAADTQIWTAMYVQARAADTGPTGWLDLHARRRGDGILYIVRPGAGYTFSKALALHAGYAWVPVITDEGANRSEHRAWEQVIVNHPVGDAVKLQGRARLEQRFGAGDDIGHRLRLLARGQWAPSPSLPLQLVVWDELFLGFNETDWGAPRGYDQNRAFVGLGADTKLRGIRVEAGYMNVVLRRDTQVDHVVAINLFVVAAP
jgi:hypothetical protein